MAVNNLIPLKPLLFDLNEGYSLIEVSGKEAASFLQGQLTLDIRQITPIQGGWSAYCNVKGRIRALLRVFLYQESYYLQLPTLLLPPILHHLQQYAKFSKISLKDVSSTWQRIGIEVDETLQSLLTQHPHSFIQLLITDKMSYPRFEILAPSPSLSSLWQTLSLQAKVGSFQDWVLLDIRSGIPEVWPETSEAFLPHSLNLPQLGAVSFNKGCYCGQEIIARMEYRAKIKRHMFKAQLLNTTFVPIPGTPVWLGNHSKETIGTVISASPASENTVEMLIEGLDSIVANHQPITLELQNQRIAIELQY